MEQGNLDQRLARRFASLRSAQNWSLDELAQKTGVSRTTLSRLERAETSPTAELLGRLCSAYCLTMSRLLAEVESAGTAALSAQQQLCWRDAASGFVRRAVSPPAQGFQSELVEGYLPAGAQVRYEAPPIHGLEQHLWLLEGRLKLTLEHSYQLEAGDSLRMRLFGASSFEANGEQAARYVLAITR